MTDETNKHKRIEEILAHLQDATALLRAEDLDGVQATRLIEECSSLTSQAAAILADYAALPIAQVAGGPASAQSRLDGHRQDPLL